MKIITMLMLMFALAIAASAHDIPADVTVHAFVKPEGTRLRLLVRVPLKVMRDVNFPLRGPGFLDLSSADGFLHDAALLWIADNLAIYEGDVRVAPPRLAAARVSLPSDRSFLSYDDALNHLSGQRLPADILSALVAHTAWHWTGERWERLRQFAWPAFDATSIAALARGLMVLVVVGAVAWIIFGVLARRPSPVRITDDRRERGA